jgi:two-component system, OmpR family, alkaline phosphatase synthesis response regulator PhoP
MRILVIDDEEDIRLIARVGLSAGGHQVVEAAGGREGVEMATRERPDAIVMDLMMPDVDGLATLKLLKADPTLATVPVVILTAKAVGQEEGLRALGATAVLSKPFNPRTLGAVIARLVH